MSDLYDLPTGLNDYERDLYDACAHVLMGIAHELDCARVASDPYDIDPDYLNMMLSHTQNCVFMSDGMWSWCFPNSVSKVRIILMLNDELQSIEDSWGH